MNQSSRTVLSIVLSLFYAMIDYNEEGNPMPTHSTAAANLAGINK